LNHKIKEKREELTKINSLITTLRTDYNRRTEEIQRAQDDLTALGKQGEKLDRKRAKYLNLIAEKQKVCEKLRKTPLRKAMTAGRMVVSIQSIASQRPTGLRSRRAPAAARAKSANRTSLSRSRVTWNWSNRSSRRTAARSLSGPSRT
jgi:chromosome segregation ATPase